MNRQVDSQIAMLKDILTKRFDVERIILFGSHASGEATLDSDIDLCLIADLKDKRKLDVIRDIRRELLELISSPLDILIYSEAEFMERATLGNTLEHQIMQDGIRVYG